MDDTEKKFIIMLQLEVVVLMDCTPPPSALPPFVLFHH